ncbi:hypothetical protein TELCIR_12001, partial [Teladorsagia circumcincta]
LFHLQYPSISCCYREEEELNEEDLPIDRELIEKVLDGTFNIVSNSLARNKFDPYSEVTSYKKLDKFFTRGDTKEDLKPLVTWNTKMMVTAFDQSRRDTAVDNVRVEPLKDVIRTQTPAYN